MGQGRSLFAKVTGVIDALEFLIDVKENGAKDLGRRVAIIGGGDVAMDAARTAKRHEWQSRRYYRLPSHGNVRARIAG